MHCPCLYGAWRLSSRLQYNTVSLSIPSVYLGLITFYTKDTNAWYKCNRTLHVLLQFLLIFFLILALRVGESPTREGPGYATAFLLIPSLASIKTEYMNSSADTSLCWFQTSLPLATLPLYDGDIFTYNSTLCMKKKKKKHQSGERQASTCMIQTLSFRWILTSSNLKNIWSLVHVVCLHEIWLQTSDNSATRKTQKCDQFFSPMFDFPWILQSSLLLPSY